MRKHSRPRWVRPVSFLKPGTLKTVEDVHNNADTKYSVSPVAKIAVRPQKRKGYTEVAQSSEKETDLHSREQDGLRLCKQQTRKVRRDLERDEEHANQGFHWRKHPQLWSEFDLE